MSKLLREFVSLEYDKESIKEAKEKKSAVTVSALLQRANAQNQNKRLYPREILEREVNNYMKAVRERRALGECVTPETEVFTEDGWKPITNVSVGDRVFTLNVESGEVEVQAVYDTVEKEYKDDLVYLKNNSSISALMTKGHKVPLWDRNGKYYELTALELYQKLQEKDSGVSHSCLRRGGTWVGDSPEFVDVAGERVLANDWAAFLGIYLAEGHCAGTKGGYKSNTVGITQVKEDSKKKIEELLLRLPFDFTMSSSGRQFQCRNSSLHEHLFALGSSEKKYIPQYVKNWSPDLLGVLLEWMLLGDGKNRKDREGRLMKEYATVSPKLAEDVSEVMLKLGFGGSIHSRQPVDREIEGRTILAENSRPLYTIHEHTSKGMYLDSRFTSCELIPYEGMVYCIRTPNKTWLMRHDNKVSWTHNCDHPDSSVVELKNASHLITDMWWKDDEVWGTVEVLNTPAGQLVQSLMESGVKLGISSRGVGDTIPEGDYDVVGENFMLLAFDLVSEPSTQDAWLMSEGKEVSTAEIKKMLPKVDRVNRLVNSILKK